MSVTRFSSQIKPTDSTESVGYMFYPATTVLLPTVTNNAATISYTANTYLIAAVHNSGLPVVNWKTTATDAVMVLTPQMVPNDLDSSATCYASLVYVNTTTVTNWTAAVAMTYQAITSAEAVVAPATTIGSITNLAAGGNNNNKLYTSSSAAMSASPTPGELLSWQLDITPDATDAVAVVGVKVQYTRRFV
jgi:hypothetical protein